MSLWPRRRRAGSGGGGRQPGAHPVERGHLRPDQLARHRDRFLRAGARREGDGQAAAGSVAQFRFGDRGGEFLGIGAARLAGDLVLLIGMKRSGRPCASRAAFQSRAAPA